MKRYDEIMDRLTVTDEMRERVLGSIQKARISETAARGAVRFPLHRRRLAAAACFLILLAGTLVAPYLQNAWQPGDSVVLGPSGIAEAASLDALEQAVGFAVAGPAHLPFTVEETSYVAYGQFLAEITYTGGEQTAVFRKSPGTDDNSGDYSSYGDVREIDAGSVAATLKGENGLYTLAIWTDGDFAYSLQLSDGLTPEQWNALLTASS